MEATAAARLVEESTRRAGLVWLAAAGSDAPAQPVWHVWLEGAAYVLTGPGEQPVPDGVADGGRAVVTVPSKDKGSRLVAWPAAVGRVDPGAEGWTEVAAALKGKRLNAADGEAAVDRWARECTVLRLVPDGPVLETPDDPTTGSHAAPPPPTPATTRVPRPWHFGGRTRRHVD